MSMVLPSVETDVIDYSLADVACAEIPTGAVPSKFTARIGFTTILIRDLSDDFTDKFELKNEAATERIEHLAKTGQLSRMVLVRAPNIVWALWDTVGNDIYPVTSRPRFIPEDRYEKAEFFERLGKQARKIKAMLDEARRDGNIELIGN